MLNGYRRQASAVEADIGFLIPRAGPLFTYGHEAPSGGEPATTEFEPRRVLIQDLRATAPLSLEANAVEFGYWPTAVRNFYDAEQVRGVYYAEAAELIRARLGAERVLMFDHNVRRGDGLAVQPGHYVLARPVTHAHVDFTATSAPIRLQRELDLLGTRGGYRRLVQVNLWRPIAAPLRDAPLALCDGSSVAPESLRRVELRYPERTGEIYYLEYAPEQRWYFASDMAVDEAWLFKNYDSAAAAQRPGFAPHSAFLDTCWKHVAPRQSIEVRAFALFG
ncbi:MAG: methyltransferase [Gammaproteobacteria bacterium]|nr:methyltransferase [Gammaproteobacteria bacterium]